MSEKEQVIIEINTETDEAQRRIDALRKSMADLREDKPGNSFKSFKAELKAATELAYQARKEFGDGSKVYAEALKTVADIKDKIDEYNRSVSDFNPGNKLQSVVSIAQGATTAVQGVTGAFQFLGVEAGTSTEAIAKLQGLMAFSDSLNSIGDINDSFKNLTALIKGTIPAQEGASFAARGFGLALKSIGIGLITAAIAYLISNWDSLKQSVTNLIPGLDKAGETFNKVKAVVLGVGNAVVQFLITPVKAFVDVINGDFSKAVDDIKQGYNVIGNAQKGYEEARSKQAADSERERIENLIKSQEQALKLIKAAGQDGTALERQILNNKIKVQQEGSEEQREAITDLSEFELKTLKEKHDKQKTLDDQAAAKRKQQWEKEQQERKQLLERQKELEEEVTSDLAKATADARGDELIDLKRWYEEKHKIAIGNLGLLNKLEEDFRLKRKAINDKYDLQELEEQKAKAERLAQRAQTSVGNVIAGLKAQDEKSKAKKADASQANLIQAEREFAPDDDDEIAQAVQKVQSLADARIQAENDAFAREFAEKTRNNESTLALEQQHQTNILNIKKDADDAEETLNKKKLERLNTYGSALKSNLSNATEVLGKQTAAGKATAIAAATIDTYQSATAAFKSLAGIPIVGPALGAAAAAVAIFAGIKNIKEIAKVKVPGSSTGSGTIPSISTPPPISSTQIAQSTTQDVRVVNQDDTPVKTYVTEKDLNESAQRQQLYKSLNTF